jgi:hypothetical protein
MQNTEFPQALAQTLQTTYQHSWVHQIFEVVVWSPENNKVVGFREAKDQWHNSNRYTVLVAVPDPVKPYFAPSALWKTHSAEFVPVQVLSQYANVFDTSAYPYTKSPFYEAPYTLRFASSQRVPSNALLFNAFGKPNSPQTILALLSYDDNEDRFQPIYTNEIILPYKKSSMLNNLLEFRIFDAQKKQVEFKNYSQLYISIEFA